MIRKLAKNEYRLIPHFLHINFNNREGGISIEDFVRDLYKRRKVDMMGKIYLFLFPNSNYLIYHGYDDICDPNVDFFRVYNVDESNETYSEQGKDEVYNEAIQFHINRDVQFLSEKKQQLAELQQEVSEILNAIEESKKLNDMIASIYKDVSDLDVQEIFKYHRHLYEESLNEILNNNLENGLEMLEDNALWNVDGEDEVIPSKIALFEDVILHIKQRESEDEFLINNGMPPFNPEKYEQLLNIWQFNPHINQKEQSDIVVAGFAGNLTDKLEERLKNIHPVISKPVKHSKTGAWNYRLDTTQDIISLLYLHLIDYCNEMFEEIGWITRCSWCGQFINPDNRQRAHLRNNKSIYCKFPTVSNSTHSCQEQARIHKQATKRSKEKRSKH